MRNRRFGRGHRRGWRVRFGSSYGCRGCPCEGFFLEGGDSFLEGVVRGGDRKTDGLEKGGGWWLVDGGWDEGVIGLIWGWELRRA